MGWVRVVVTRIRADGTMYRHMVDTAQQSGPWKWADLTARPLAAQPPYRPVPGTAVYHVCADGCTVQVGEYDLDGPLRDLVTVVLAMGREPGNDHEILGSALTEKLSVPAGWTGFADPFQGYAYLFPRVAVLAGLPGVVQNEPAHGGRELRGALQASHGVGIHDGQVKVRPVAEHGPCRNPAT